MYDQITPQLQRLPRTVTRYYTGRNLADGSDLGETIKKGYPVCLDLYGDPDLAAASDIDVMSGGAKGLTGGNVTKPQTENVNDFEGIIVALGDPSNPTLPQTVTIVPRDGGFVNAYTLVDQSAARSGSVPGAVGVPLACVADQWHLVGAATTSVDTHAEINNYVGKALEDTDTSGAAALQKVLLRNR